MQVCADSATPALDVRWHRRRTMATIMLLSNTALLLFENLAPHGEGQDIDHRAVMLSFAVRGSIAWVEPTAGDETGFGPAAIVLDVGDSRMRIIVAAGSIKPGTLSEHCVVDVHGNVQHTRRGLHHVATEVRVVSRVH